MIKRTIRILLKSLLCLLIFIGVYFLLAFGLSRIAINKNANDTPFIDIYILTNGVHTDIVVPAKHDLSDWTKTIPISNTRGNDSSTKYLAIGWAFIWKRQRGQTSKHLLL